MYIPNPMDSYHGTGLADYLLQLPLTTVCGKKEQNKIFIITSVYRLLQRSQTYKIQKMHFKSVGF